MRLILVSQGSRKEKGRPDVILPLGLQTFCSSGSWWEALGAWHGGGWPRESCQQTLQAMGLFPARKASLLRLLNELTMHIFSQVQWHHVAARNWP